MENTSIVLKEWVELYTSEMLSWAVYKTSDQQTAEDLVQETFLAAFQAYHTFENKSKPKTWLFGILKNKIIDHYRKSFKTSTSTIEQTEDEQGIQLYGFLFDTNGHWKKEKSPQEWSNSSIELLDNPEFNNVLIICLNKLPIHWHAAIKLKYMEDKDATYICKELDISTTNYWQIIHRAKLQLRSCLENYWFKNE
jgi:RNA polymerase sigma-70 factor (TIGR02943 family)